MGALAAAAVSAGLSAASSAATSAVNNRRKYDYWLKQQDKLEQMQIAAEKRQMDYNKELQDYVYSQNLEQWKRENRYNSPSEQMARYRQAGLNGNLIYGQSNLASSSPEMVIGDVGTGSAQNASPLDVEGINLDPATFQRIINETNLANANVENINADTEKKETEMGNIEEDTRGKKIENDFKQDLNPISLERAAKELDKVENENQLIRAQIKNINLDSALKTYEQMLKQLDIQIKRVDADYADELMELRIKKENAQISFVNHQIALLGKQLASYDDELKARLALSAAETLNRTAFANLADSRSTYQDFVNKMNSILLDPTVDTDNDVYWSALMLKNLSETSALDVIEEARKILSGSDSDSDSDSNPSRPSARQRENEIDEPAEDGNRSSVDWNAINAENRRRAGLSE